MQDSLVALQELVAYQEQEIARLSDELYAQQKEVAVLAQKFARLEAQMKAGAGDSHMRKPEEETPPPHY